jgi:hypothetical protein
MNAGFHVEAWVISKSIEYDPEVTPRGNPEKVGTCMATPEVATPGRAVQQ